MVVHPATTIFVSAPRALGRRFVTRLRAVGRDDAIGGSGRLPD